MWSCGGGMGGRPGQVSGEAVGSRRGGQRRRSVSPRCVQVRPSPSAGAGPLPPPEDGDHVVEQDAVVGGHKLEVDKVRQRPARRGGAGRPGRGCTPGCPWPQVGPQNACSQAPRPLQACARGDHPGALQPHQST